MTQVEEQASPALELRFLTESDFSATWGQISMQGHTVEPTSEFVAPPLNYTAGAIVFVSTTQSHHAIPPRNPHHDPISNNDPDRLLPFFQGAFAGYPGTEDEGSYVLYAAQTAGPEPLITASGLSSSADDLSERTKSLTVEVLRFVTDDLRSYRAPSVCLKFKTGGDPYPYTLPTVKSMARDSRSGEMIMVVLGEGQAISVYRSTDNRGITNCNINANCF